MLGLLFGFQPNIHPSKALNALKVKRQLQFYRARVLVQRQNLHQMLKKHSFGKE